MTTYHYIAQKISTPPHATGSQIHGPLKTEYSSSLELSFTMAVYLISYQMKSKARSRFPYGV